MDEKYRRERYTNCPLVEVVFQLRFPTILSINTNSPVDFQDRIRDRYPFYTEQTENQDEYFLSPQQGPQLRRKTNSKNHNFISEDRKCKINLTPSFISISTREYTQWEDFRKHIEFIVPVFEEIYKPNFYIREGLRYVDLFIREDLGLKGTPWTKLIKPHLLGMMTTEHEAGTKAYTSQIEYETGLKGILSTAHFELVHVNDKSELAFLIDCDYYKIDITKLEEMKNVAEDLHNASSNFIRSSISDELRQAMGPVEIEK